MKFSILSVFLVLLFASASWNLYLVDERELSLNTKAIATLQDFNDLPAYVEIDALDQLKEYKNLYSCLGSNSAKASSDLFIILKSRLFPLVREFIFNNHGNNKSQKSLFALEKLYNNQREKALHGNFLVKDFWQTNIIAAIIIDWHKGIITGEINHGEQTFDQNISVIIDNIEKGNENIFDHPLGLSNVSLKYLDGVADQIENHRFPCEIFWNISIVYTAQSEHISKKVLLENLLKNQSNVISVFDCSLKPYCSHYDDLGKYLPHYGSLTTSTFLFHDHEHGSSLMKLKIPMHIFDRLSTSLAHLFDDTKNSNEQKIIVEGLFFIFHELGNLDSFSNKFQLPPMFPYIHKKANDEQEQSTLLGLIINELYRRMPIIVKKEKVYDSVQGLEVEYKRRSSKIQISDWSLMLHDQIPSPQAAKEANSIKFTFAPGFDPNGHNFLPSLDDLLMQADISGVDNIDKIAVWKSVKKSTQKKLKQQALANGYSRFWKSFYLLMEKQDPNLLIKPQHIHADSCKKKPAGKKISVVSFVFAFGILTLGTLVFYGSVI